jgi:hypothetical protein
MNFSSPFRSRRTAFNEDDDDDEEEEDGKNEDEVPSSVPDRPELSHAERRELKKRQTAERDGEELIMNQNRLTENLSTVCPT